MIIHDDWLFISVRKCATNALYKALKEVGGQRHGGGFHGSPGQGERLRPLHFTVVRNPYDRAVSIYASTVLRQGDSYGAKRQCDGSFEDFCRRCLITDKQRWGREPWLFRNQNCWLRGLVIDEHLRFEQLADELYRLIGFDHSLPRENDSEHELWQSYFSDQIILDYVNEWAGDDFELYGYDRIDEPEHLLADDKYADS